jgi:hypothetical protein
LAPELADMVIAHAPAEDSCTFSSVHNACINLVTLALFRARPWFIKVRHSGRDVYLLGTKILPDAEMSISSADQELPLVTIAIAILVYVRLHFPERAWRPGQCFANFIIDDPLLRPSYGFVRHEELFRHVSTLGAAATIAFIPWNARRSDPATISLYRSSKTLSLCAHGHEHTSDEFVSHDLGHLQLKAFEAIQGMRRHRALTGVPYEPVMVFPQGRFAALAFEALDSAGFLAVANSTFLARGVQPVVRLKHLLLPAVPTYGHLPLFRRRAPAYLDRFRYDLILGKPVLLAEHHMFFKDAGDGFGRVIREVQRLAPSVRWMPLGDIARGTYLSTVVGEGRRRIKFFTRELSLPATGRCKYQFIKPNTGPEAGTVRVNGHRAEHWYDGRDLLFTAEVAGDVEIRIQPETQRLQTPHHSPSYRHRMSVAARRYLSEFRDNYLHTRFSLLGKSVS